VAQVESRSERRTRGATFTPPRPRACAHAGGLLRQWHPRNAEVDAGTLCPERRHAERPGLHVRRCPTDARWRYQNFRVTGFEGQAGRRPSKWMLN
jgi:hypothetical protein